jgi:hypothetical protein
MNRATSLRHKGRPNGLALFAGAIVVLAMGIVIGANLLFDRSASRPLPPDSQSAAASAAGSSAPAVGEAMRPVMPASGRHT